jgi:hypothetical protein
MRVPRGIVVYACLHLNEGDTSNLQYWYGCAGKPAARARGPLEEEWNKMASFLLG